MNYLEDQARVDWVRYSGGVETGETSFIISHHDHYMRFLASSAQSM
jgi:hypothetical protein